MLHFFSPRPGGDHFEFVRRHAEIHGQVADHLAIDFHGHLARAADDGAGRLEIFHVVHVRMRAEHDAAQIAGDVEIAEVFEDHHVQLAVIDLCVLENDEGAAVKAPVADQHEGPVLLFAARIDHEAGGFARGDLRGGDEVAQRAEIFPEIAVGLLHDLGVEAHAPELHESVLVGHREIDNARVAGLDDLPALAQIAGGNAEFRGEDIHRADGQEAQRHVGTGKAVHHLVHRAVAARRDHDLAALLHGLPRKFPRLARLGGGAHKRVPGKAADFFPQRLRLFPPGRRI